ncbi:DUF3304 domain-containing protein [Luteimonas sp. SJ-92]|uniref:DUF3304 domain-containing protein n=1 Tax=Luteimonas salinisoli TaxID=2752307 RepID=A0A853JGG7_9GAMM|nr:DUF3304 domain-containing protein [Luteimonas salinisoli]NZA28501.1 DUF3304 domain-containing protein [Luteimonas salinisoli]
MGKNSASLYLGIRSAQITILLFPVLAACGNGSAYTDPATGERTFGSSVTLMRHNPTDTLARSGMVESAWGGPAGTGGTAVCCVSFPVRWRQGLQAKLCRERSEPFDRENPVLGEEACDRHENVLSVHQYEKLGRTWLHISSDSEVLVIPSMVGPGHPEHHGLDFPAKDYFSEREVS